MRRPWLAAVLLHLLTGCTALPTLRPDLLHTEQLQLHTNGIDDGVTMTVQSAGSAPDRTLAASELADILRVNTHTLSAGADSLSETEDLVSEEHRPVSYIADGLGEGVGPLDADEDDDENYDDDEATETPSRLAAVTAAPPGPELTSAATSGQHCPSQCVCFDLTVDCSSRELRELPAALPNWTNVL